MSFQISITEDLRKTITVLKRKNPPFFHALEKKMIQIASSDLQTINHYKNLRGNLKEYKRVHLGSYVLLFRIQDKTIIFTTLQHHDVVYKTR